MPAMNSLEYSENFLSINIFKAYSIVNYLDAVII